MWKDLSIYLNENIISKADWVNTNIRLLYRCTDKHLSIFKKICHSNSISDESEHLYLPLTDLVGKCFKNFKSFRAEKHSAFNISQL